MKEFKYNKTLTRDLRIKIACWWFGHDWKSIESETKKHTLANGRTTTTFYVKRACKRCGELNVKHQFTI